MAKMMIRMIMRMIKFLMMMRVMTYILVLFGRHKL